MPNRTYAGLNLNLDYSDFIEGIEQIFVVAKYTSARSEAQNNFPKTDLVSIYVRGRGLEPPRPCGHRHLKPAWLPITAPAR